MKVMFLFQGLPHYYNYVLNRLDAVNGIDIINVIPRNTSKGIGDGVFQTKNDIQFQLRELKEFRPIYGGFFFRSLWKEILRIRPDVIVTTEAHLRGFILNFPTFLVTKLLRIPIILKTHPFGVPLYKDINQSFLKKPLVIYWLKRLFSPLFRFFYQFPSACVCYIEEAFIILGSYGVKREKIFITYNSPDTDRLTTIYEEIKKKDYRFYKHRLIHVGRLVEWKRVDLLLFALVELKKKYTDVELLVVGEGPEKEKLHKLAKDLGVHDCVQFLGGVYDPRQLGEYLMSSSIYVLAGMGGLSINEAMCFGKPIICSRGDGTEKHLVREGVNGFFFKEGDTNDLKEKVEQLFNHPELREQMGKKSLDIICNEVNIHTVVRGYVRAFEYVTGRKCV